MRIIDADALIEALDSFILDETTDVHGDTVREILERLPTIEERKTGKWIIQDNPVTGWYKVACSECGENVTSNIPMIGFFPHCKPLWNYCPECGADMTEVK